MDDNKICEFFGGVIVSWDCILKDYCRWEVDGWFELGDE